MQPAGPRLGGYGWIWAPGGAAMMLVEGEEEDGGGGGPGEDGEIARGADEDRGAQRTGRRARELASVSRVGGVGRRRNDDKSSRVRKTSSPRGPPTHPTLRPSSVKREKPLRLPKRTSGGYENNIPLMHVAANTTINNRKFQLHQYTTKTNCLTNEWLNIVH